MADPLRWRARVNAVNVDVALLLAPLKDFIGDAEGSVFVDASLDGAGVSVASILSSLEGPVTLTTRGVRIGALTAVTKVVDAIWGTLAKVPGLNEAPAPGVGASLADGTWTFARTRDRYRLDEPMHVETNLGVFELTGQLGFDAHVELKAQLGLTAGVLNILQLPESETLPLGLKMAGPWNDLKISLDDDEVITAAINNHLQNLALTPVAAIVETMTGQTVERGADDGLFRAIERALQRAAAVVAAAVDAEVLEAERSMQQTLGTPAPTERAAEVIEGPPVTEPKKKQAKKKTSSSSPPTP